MDYYDDCDRRMKCFRHMGIGKIRHDINMDRIVKWDGSYNWTNTDRLIAAAEKHGVEILPVLTGDTENATSGDPEKIKHFTDFISEVATRYKGKIKMWEVWNEQDYAGFWGSAPNPENYIKLLKAVRDALKAVDPECKIVLGGLMGRVHWRGGQMVYPFLNALYEAGAKDLFDVLNAHVYPAETRSVGKVSEEEFFRTTITGLKLTMERNADKGKPLYISEIGETSGTNDHFANVTPEEKARLLKEYYKIAEETGVTIYWHRARDVREIPESPHQNYGLFKCDGTPTPAAEALYEQIEQDQPRGRTLKGAFAMLLSVEMVEAEYNTDAERTFGMMKDLPESTHYRVVANTDRMEEEHIKALEEQAGFIQARNKRGITIEVKKNALGKDRPTYVFTCSKGEEGELIGETAIDLAAHPKALDRTNAILNIGLLASAMPKDPAALREFKTERPEEYENLKNYLNSQYKSLVLVGATLIKDTATPAQIAEILKSIAIVLPPVELPKDIENRLDQLNLQSRALDRAA